MQALGAPALAGEEGRNFGRTIAAAGGQGARESGWCTTGAAQAAPTALGPRLSPRTALLRPAAPPQRPSRAPRHPRYTTPGGPARGVVTAMAASDKQAAANNPGLVEDVDPATKPYIMQQTMYRIKDPKASLRFYSEVLGMRLLKRLDFPEAKFSLYFMGYENPEEIPTDEAERVKWTFSRRATIELTHNYGTESDPDFTGYHNGNTDPRGFGHIGVMVDDVYTACARFEKLGVDFVKKPDDGRMKGLAFIKDPDGYWIEIFDTKHMASILTT